MAVGVAVGGTSVGVSVGGTAVAEGMMVGVAGMIVDVTVGGRVVEAALQPARIKPVKTTRSMKMIFLIIYSSDDRCMSMISR
jgi:hypothetical protein